MQNLGVLVPVLQGVGGFHGIGEAHEWDVVVGDDAGAVGRRQTTLRKVRNVQSVWKGRLRRRREHGG